MAEEFILDWKVDQPALLAGRSETLYTMVTVRPNMSKLGALLESGASAATLPAHVIVVVDVSGSMQSLIKDDPHARVIGRGTAEGSNVNYVESDVPSRLAVAQRVVQRLARRLSAGDRMTLVAFDQQAYPLANAYAPGQALDAAIAHLGDHGGGGTSMGRAFQAVSKSLASSESGSETRKLIVLTDGEDQEPELALEQARRLATEHKIPVHAVGTGDCRTEFLTQIAKETLGAFDNIDDDQQAEQFFDEALTRQKNILATGVTLSLWLSPEIFVQELYRTKPEVLYFGTMKPSADNTVVVPVEYMEKNKTYEFLFHCTAPAREPGRFRLAKASLNYDVPALGVTGEKTEVNVIVEYTTDSERALVRVGDVRRVIAQAEVQRQVLFLQQKIDALKAHRGTDKDPAIVARMLDNLIKKYEEFSDQANANLYRKMRDDFSANGTISQDMLNRSLAASSKVEETLSVQEIDDF